MDSPFRVIGAARPGNAGYRNGRDATTRRRPALRRRRPSPRCRGSTTATPPLTRTERSLAMKVLTTQDCGYVARKNAVHAWTPDEERDDGAAGVQDPVRRSRARQCQLTVTRSPQSNRELDPSGPCPGRQDARTSGEVASYSGIQPAPRPSVSLPNRRRSAIVMSRLYAVSGELRWLLAPRSRSASTTLLARRRRAGSLGANAEIRMVGL